MKEYLKLFIAMPVSFASAAQIPNAGLYFYLITEKSGSAQASGKFCVLR